jgi:hypothetical protein
LTDKNKLKRGEKMTDSSDRLKPISLEVTIDLKERTKEEEWPNIAAYVFSRSGTFLGKQPLEPDAKNPTIGRAELKVKTDLEDVVVKVGPDIEDVKKLERYNPAVNSVKLEDTMHIKLDLVKPFWKCWLKVPYHVKGTVKKQTGGSSAPICAGEVEIYDVDIVYCIPLLPDTVIEKIRDGIIDIIVNPPPVIDPSPIQFGKPLVWWEWEEDEYCGTNPIPGPLPRATIIKKLEGLPPQWSFAKQRFEDLPMARKRMNTLLEDMSLAKRQAFLNTDFVEDVKISQVLYSNTAQFRDMLITEFIKIKFWLCWWPWIYWIWWPYCAYSLEKLGTATLQPDGSFSATVYLSICRNDKPDLWFVVRQNINGVDRVIYARHPVPCNTLWDYPSGKPVYLIVTDPSAVACAQQIPGISPGYVIPMGIYHDEWCDIDQAHIKSKCDPNTKLPYACGLYNGTDPYGTRLDFRMQFHKNLRNIGVMYYRWSYRKHGTTKWIPIDHTITHQYIKSIKVKVPFGLQIETEDEILGPNKNNLFSVPDPNKAWVDKRDDLAFAIWHTDQLPNGKYDLLLEMFDKNGNKLDPQTAGFTYALQTKKVGKFDNKLYVEKGGLEKGGLILHLHIDNRDTIAEIKSISLNKNPAKECQFLEYSDKTIDEVNVEYVAYHPATPHNFLDHYDLLITRGISGKTVDDSMKNSVTPVSKSKTVDFKVKDLLDTYDQCSFGVHLHTYPRTRDGYSRIHAYEDSDISNFALAKK